MSLSFYSVILLKFLSPNFFDKKMSLVMLGCIICIPLNKIIYQATQVCIILAKYCIHRSAEFRNITDLFDHLQNINTV